MLQHAKLAYGDRQVWKCVAAKILQRSMGDVWWVR